MFINTYITDVFLLMKIGGEVGLLRNRVHHLEKNRLLQQEGCKCLRKDLPQSPIMSFAHRTE